METININQKRISAADAERNCESVLVPATESCAAWWTPPSGRVRGGMGLSKINTKNAVITDVDGEVLDISQMNLVAIDPLDCPKLSVEYVRYVTEAIEDCSTFDQRHLPLHKKLQLLWSVFQKLFLDNTRPVYWPMSFKEKRTQILRHVKMYFVRPSFAKKMGWSN